MAWVYTMAIRCANETIAGALAGKYAGQTITFDSEIGRSEDVCKFAAEARQIDGEWWAEIVPSKVTTTAIGNDQEASRANQFCNVIYGMLRNERHFDYALAGVETSEFRTLQELKQEFADGSARNFDGLVVSKNLLAEWGLPDYFVDFSDTHKWIPKKPERYPWQSLGSSIAKAPTGRPESREDAPVAANVEVDHVRELLRTLAEIRDGAFQTLYVDLSRRVAPQSPRIEFRIARVADSENAMLSVGVTAIRKDGIEVHWSVGLSASEQSLDVWGSVEIDKGDGFQEVFIKTKKSADGAMAACFLRTYAAHVCSQLHWFEHDKI